MSEEQEIEFKVFVEKLPAVSSHYCRSSSKKKYLPVEFKSVSHVYRYYKTEQIDRGLNPISQKTFLKKIRSDYNLGIHVPKKDQCDVCEIFANTETPTEQQYTDYNFHISQKEIAKQYFLKEQDSAKDKPPVIIASMDLQKVLSTPNGKSMLLSYSRKYSVYNFTIYESTRQNGYCYFWEEQQGKRGSNEIASNIYEYLLMIDQS